MAASGSEMPCARPRWLRDLPPILHRPRLALYALAAELEAEIRGGRSAVPGLRRLERAIDETRREINGMLGA